MVPSQELGTRSLEIVADIRYSDAVHATLAQFSRRARFGLWTYAVSLAVSMAAAWLVGGALAWLPAVLGAVGCAAVSLAAWVARRDFRKSGGKPLRMRYHICGSGVEILAAGRGDWVAWENVWDAGETRRSFLVSPGPGEHYVIPKRCCDAAAVESLRETLRSAGALAAGG